MNQQRSPIQSDNVDLPPVRAAGFTAVLQGLLIFVPTFVLGAGPVADAIITAPRLNSTLP